MSIIDQEARRLIRLVENVLQFSRTGKQRNGLNLEQIMLRDFVGDSIAAFEPLTLTKHVTVNNEVPSGLQIIADRNALRQVLVNLLDNAVKYGPDGQVVTVTAHKSDNSIELGIEDQGPGIPHDVRDDVWEAFYRLDREDPSSDGSGIGLSLVRDLVEGMGGSVSIEDAPAGGARFTVALKSAP